MSIKGFNIDGNIEKYDYESLDNKPDSTSVTITNVTQSTEDGGSNIVTFSDGKTLTIKNGSKGSQGEKGADGAKGDKGDTGANGSNGKDGLDGKDGVSATHSWNGTVLTVTSASGTSSANLKGESGVYVGSGDMPADCNVQIDPDGEVIVLDDIRESIAQLSSEKVDKNQGSENVGKILVVGTDGNLTLADMPEGGASGDVIGVLDESNNILLSGNLSDGKYTLKYENTDGTYTEVGELVIGEIEPPKTNFFVVGGDGYLNPGRASGKGEDRTDVASCLLSNYIAVQNGDVVYVEGMVLSGNASSFSALYKADKTSGVGFKIDASPTQLKDVVFTETGGNFTINLETAGLIRINGVIPADLSAVKITIKRNGEWL